MKAIVLTLDLPPLGNRAYRNWGGRMVMSPEARLYKANVLESLQSENITALDGTISVSMDVYRKRKAGDLDGYAKILLDSMQGICYANDKQIVELHARRFDDKHHPRVHVTIEQVKL
jgi:Holliday junction resolvase RusA-like endonuclease